MPGPETACSNCLSTQAAIFGRNAAGNYAANECRTREKEEAEAEVEAEVGADADAEAEEGRNGDWTYPWLALAR